MERRNATLTQYTEIKRVDFDSRHTGITASGLLPAVTRNGVPREGMLIFR